MRTGIFGGTFNPIHNGHIKLARAYRSELELDRMLVIPTRIPPHKVSTELADGKESSEYRELKKEALLKRAGQMTSANARHYFIASAKNLG